MPKNETYDVAIIGGGPAGLSAALWLARYLHKVVLVDSGDPRNWETRGINGFLAGTILLASAVENGRRMAATTSSKAPTLPALTSGYYLSKVNFSAETRKGPFN